MQLLLDENMPGWAVRDARARGHEAAWVRDVSPGVPDEVIIERLRTTREILVTRDIGFANLCFSLLSDSRLESAVVLVRAQVLADLRRAWDRLMTIDYELEGIAVVRPGDIRIRRVHAPGS